MHEVLRALAPAMGVVGGAMFGMAIGMTDYGRTPPVWLIGGAIVLMATAIYTIRREWKETRY